MVERTDIPVTVVDSPSEDAPKWIEYISGENHTQMMAEVVVRWHADQGVTYAVRGQLNPDTTPAVDITYLQTEYLKHGKWFNPYWQLLRREHEKWERETNPTPYIEE